MDPMAWPDTSLGQRYMALILSLGLCVMQLFNIVQSFHRNALVLPSSDQCLAGITRSKASAPLLSRRNFFRGVTSRHANHATTLHTTINIRPLSNKHN